MKYNTCRSSCCPCNFGDYVVFLWYVDFIACSTNQSAVEQEMWPDNPQHGSPVPRPLGRQKRLVESIVTPVSTTASHSGSQTHAQHLPWQLDLHSKLIQQQQQQIQLQEQQQQQQQQQQQSDVLWHHASYPMREQQHHHLVFLWDQPCHVKDARCWIPDLILVIRFTWGTTNSICVVLWDRYFIKNQCS